MKGKSKKKGVTENLGLKYEPPEITEVLIAALNEEEGIRATILELKDTIEVNRFLVVDGHSQDRTVEAAKDCGADVIFQDGKGKGDAIAKAIQNMDANTKYAVITDADYTYPATYLPEMIHILEQHPWVGMVCGNRFHEKPYGPAFQGRFSLGNKMLSFAHGLLNGVDLKDPLTGLRVVRAEVLRNWAVKSKGFDIEVELNVEVERQGYETVEVPIVYRQRLGKKKLQVRHGVEILKRILKGSFVQDSLGDRLFGQFQI